MTDLAFVLVLALAAAGEPAAQPAPPPSPAPSLAEQQPGTWVRRLAARPMEDVGLLPRLSYESSLAYDRHNKVAVMWGGHGLQCDSPQLDETWIYDPAANAWRESAAPRRPMGSCCVRDSTYDEVAGRVVQLEGHSGGHGWQFIRHKGWGLRAGGPWLYDAAADRWAPMRPPFGPATRPYKALAYSPDHFVSLMFSGEGQKNDTWAYDSYANAWFEMGGAARPPACLGAGMVYDRKRKVFVMLAPAAPEVGKPANPRGLWTFDPATNLWKELRTEHSPAAGPNAVPVYDEAAATTLCFEAVEATEKGKWRMLVWALDLDKSDWADVTPAGAGPAYYNHAAVYAPELNIHIVGPGHTNWKTGHPTVRETWTYRHKEGKAPGPSPVRKFSVLTEEKAVAVREEPMPQRAYEASTVFRAEGEYPWKLSWIELSPGFAAAPENEGGMILRDAKVERGKVYWYRLKVGDQFTTPLRAQPAVPACPLVILKNERETEIAWAANAEKDLAGY
ncbi:MAG TPA: hypothetical protein PK280_18100, partial [Planctomycetota bacterium]|nr:hypothetical protein [Planctomycetota bacterium]